jgi:Leucine-rich repeat (LRR) protein/TRAP-type C4-dicarboxylate transport system substrate-binding protein
MRLLNDKLIRILGFILVLSLLAGFLVPATPTLSAPGPTEIAPIATNKYQSASTPVTFPDPGLEEAIRDAIGKTSGDIYESDLLSVTSLDLDESNIFNLAGIQYCTNLVHLNLYNNYITDISPLAALTKLIFLELGSNQIRDISYLSGLTNIQYIFINNNQITNVSLPNLIDLQYLVLDNNQINAISLTHCAELEYLSLNNNQIANISLSNSTNLQYLDLENNQLVNITSLVSLNRLNELKLNHNQIIEITPLTSLNELTKLSLSHNRINNISSLAELTNLELLSLDHNQITNISSLASLNKLADLDLSNNQICDISSLAGLTDLMYLSLDGNQITDISSLASLNTLTKLDLSNNQIIDTSSLAGLTDIKYLSLDHNQITNILSLASLNKLRELDLSNNQIIDVSFLAGLTDLVTLSLNDNQITNILSLVSLNELIELGLDNNMISDISCLGGLANLQSLNCGNNQIRNVSLSGCIDLGYLYLNDNPLELISLHNLPSLSNLDLYATPLETISFSDLPDLYYLYLDHHKINTISLTNLINLRYLYLNDNQIDNISFSNLPTLILLNLNDNQITNVSTLEGLTTLRNLQLGNNQIGDIQPLSSMHRLVRLEIGNNQIVDLSVLSGLTYLNELYIGNNQITDITALSSLTNLNALDIGFNSIADISPLTELVRLNWICLGSNQISDISSLITNEGINSEDYLDLTNNNLDLTRGSQNITDIQTLINRGVKITFRYLSQTRLLAVMNDDYQSVSDLPQNPRIGLWNCDESDILWLQTAFNSYGITSFSGIQLTNIERYVYLDEGNIDAVLLTVHPDFLFQYAGELNTIRLLPWSEQAVDSVVQAYPDSVFSALLPGNTYNWQNTDIQGYSPCATVQDSTTTSLVSSTSSSYYSQPVTFTATVNTGSQQLPFGTVTFKDGETATKTVTLDVFGQAVFKTSSLAPGDHNITAVYYGDVYFSKSSSEAIILTVTDNTEYELIFIDQFDSSEPEGIADELLGTMISEATNGRVTVTYDHKSPQEADEFLTLLDNGTADIACIQPEEYPDDFLLENGLSIPLLGFTTRQQRSEVSTQLYQEGYLKGLANYKLVSFQPSAPSIIFSKRKISTVEDFKGMKVCTDSFQISELTKTIGAVPVRGSVRDAYELIQKGVCDGQVSSYDSVLDYKTYEVERYSLSDPLNVDSQFVIMSKSAWNKFPKDIQTVLDKVFRDYREAYLASKQDDDANWINSLTTKGMQVSALSPDQFTRMKMLTSPTVPNWIDKTEAKGYPAKAMISRLNQLLNIKPVITTSSLTDGFAGYSYSQSLIAIDGITPYTWSISSGKLPSGLNISSRTGLISGTPKVKISSVTTYSFTVKVTDMSSPKTSITKDLFINIHPPVLITADSTPVAEIGVPYTGWTPDANVDTGPFDWTLQKGTLPPGLSLNPATGAISGTPTGILKAKKSYTITIKVTDILERSASKIITIKVYPAISITSIQLPNGEQGVVYKKQILKASGGKGNLTWLLKTDLPDGLVFSGKSISGTPTKAGTYTLSFQVTDTIGTADKDFQLTIYDQPSITTQQELPSGQLKTTYNDQQLEFSGGSGTAKSWSIVKVKGYSLPPGLRLAAKTGIISGKPTKAGLYNFRVKYTDSLGGINTKDFSIVVNP